MALKQICLSQWRIFTVKNELVDLGAQIILLGCTELSVIKRDYSIGSGFWT